MAGQVVHASFPVEALRGRRKASAALVFLVLLASTVVRAAPPASGEASPAFPARLLSEMAPPPDQPGEESWKFVADLQSPLWTSHGWSPRAATAEEADLQKGVRVDAQFPDPEGLLKTAYSDFSDFLAAGKVPSQGAFVLETAQAATATFESYRIEVTADRCRILAADTEGIRRGICHVEDLMLRAGGPFLPLGSLERKPFIKSRISRCFFGPINRPPKNRDELLDDVDYYPDQYLNRLAHEGINGLWLSILFKDLCATSIVPEFGNHVEQRLAKLRRTVEKCRRYGIRIYLYTNEPAIWSSNQPVLKTHPELAGAWGLLFCPWSEASQQYLYEATHGIFKAVPHLGGMINLSHGESPTTCLSSVSATANSKATCPRCSGKENWEVLCQVLAPMARGVHDANPDAEFITWLYMPEDVDLGDWVYEIPKHLPEHVTLQFNFESGLVADVFNRGRCGGDYWLSRPGPSPRFQRMALLAQQAGSATSAKIQTGCSHEVATVPFVPVPGHLYRKFRAMRELGVSRVMLCWYFGNYPGIMNKAAGELSFEPFPNSEEEFLQTLARTDWGTHAEEVVQAWQLFADGYSHYPVSNFFQYWGPMHDGVVWPLLLRPQDAPLAPTWLLAMHATRQPYPPSGDRIGECLAQGFTLSEAVELCRDMSDRWNQGVEILRRLEADPSTSPQRQLDIGVAKALGIQFRSGLDILRFYDLRERMAHQPPTEQLATLQEMRQLVETELADGAELLALCERDARLGFHSESEGYKYFPDKIRWRMTLLRELLDTEMPALQREIERGSDVFAEYTGRAVAGPQTHSRFCADVRRVLKETPGKYPDGLEWQSCNPPANAAPNGRQARWACCHDRDALYLLFECSDADAQSAKASHLLFMVEPRRLWPCLTFRVPTAFSWNTSHRCDYEQSSEATSQGWRGWIRIPFAAMGLDCPSPGPLRMNVSVVSGQSELAWIQRRPWPPRLMLGTDNPADLGWLFFDQTPRP